MPTYISKYVNIDKRPQKEAHTNVTDVTIGDLHANAVKFMYFLVRHGICDISEEDYERLVEIYNTGTLTKELLQKFNTIVSEKMTVINRTTLVRLLGDELADRGANDYFVLKILEKLHQEGAPVEILLSNHGVEFVEAYERFKQDEPAKPFEKIMLDPIQHAHSMTYLRKLIDDGLVSAKEVLDIVETAYKPTLKLLGYAIDTETQTITIHSHAGIGIDQIKELAKKLGVEYHDETILELAETIERINERFRRDYVENNQVHTLYTRKGMQAGYGNYRPNNDPVAFLVWNRHYNVLHRPEDHNDYHIQFTHGHDKDDFTQGNIYNLDSDVGKFSTYHTQNYRYLASTGVPLKDALAHESEKQSKLLADKRAEFNKQLELLAQKRDDLYRRNESAYVAADNLHRGLEEAANTYFSGEQNSTTYTQFKTKCDDLIQQYRPELEKHRGFKQILGNIALAILGLGVFYVAAGLIHKAQTGKFLFFQTDVGKIVDELEQKVGQIPSPPSSKTS